MLTGLALYLHYWFSVGWSLCSLIRNLESHGSGMKSSIKQPFKPFTEQVLQRLPGKAGTGLSLTRHQLYMPYLV